MNIEKDTVIHNLSDGYKITKAINQDSKIILRDKYSTPLFVLELCNDKISDISRFKNVENNEKYKKILAKFIQSFHYYVMPEVAQELGLSVIKTSNEEEIYLTSSELSAKKLNEFMRNQNQVDITLNGLALHKLTIPSDSKTCSLNLTNTNIKKVVVAHNAHILIDLSNNKSISTLVIGDHFNGNLNLSYCNLEKIKIGNNCHCDLVFNRSGKCFDLDIGSVFSGTLDIHDSCFHNLNIGYYCYAQIKLNENWGKKDINIGEFFRGRLEANSVLVENINIADDCRGKILITGKDNGFGIKHVKLSDFFSGELDIHESQSVEFVQVGKNSYGKLILQGCPSLKSVRVAENFSGFSDYKFSEDVSENCQKSGHIHWYKNLKKILGLNLQSHK